MGDVSVWVIVVLVAIAAVIVVGVVLTRRRSNRRQVAAAEWAAQWGWDFTPQDPNLAQGWQQFPFSSQGAASDVLQGTFEGVPASSFTYRSTTSARSSQVWHLVGLQLPGPLPELQLLPPKLSTIMEKLLGKNKIELQSPAFNDAWVAIAEDERFAWEFLSPAMMDRLLRGDAEKLFISVGGCHVFAGTAGAQNLDRINPTLSLLGDVVRLIPTHLISESDGRRPGT